MLDQYEMLSRQGFGRTYHVGMDMAVGESRAFHFYDAGRSKEDIEYELEQRRRHRIRMKAHKARKNRKRKNRSK